MRDEFNSIICLFILLILVSVSWAVDQQAEAIHCIARGGEPTRHNFVTWSCKELNIKELIK